MFGASPEVSCCVAAEMAQLSSYDSGNPETPETDDSVDVSVLVKPRRRGNSQTVGLVRPADPSTDRSLCFRVKERWSQQLRHRPKPKRRERKTSKTSSSSATAPTGENVFTDLTTTRTSTCCVKLTVTLSLCVAPCFWCGTKRRGSVSP